MPLDRVLDSLSKPSLTTWMGGEGVGVRVAPHSSPRYLRQSACGRQPRHVGAGYLAQMFSGANNGRDTMGMYCLRALIPVHTAGAGGIMEVLWSDYYGAVLFGEGGEIACIPHKGCRLEVVATAPTSHRGVNFLLPGQVIRYQRSFFFVDRFALPSGTKVGLWHLVGFKLQLAPSMPLPPVEELTVERRARRALERVTVSEVHK